MIIIENAASTHTASKQWHHVPPEKMLRLRFGAGYVIQKYKSTNNCLKRTSTITMKNGRFLL